MLIKKGYSANDVITLKLASGEEVIAKFVKEDDDVFTLCKPVILGMGQSGLQMMPMAFTMDPHALDEIDLPKSSVIMHGITEKSAQSDYINATTSIQVASGS